MTDENTSNDGESGGDLLSSLVGEGRKFQSVEDLAKGKVEADSFIDKLKEENNALRALIQNQEDTQRSTKVMEDLLERVSKATSERETPVNQTDNQPRNQPGSLTSKDVENIFKVLKAKEVEEQNQTKALSKIKDKYKDKAEEILKSRASELGLDIDMLMQTARRSPNAFWNLIGENTNNSTNYQAPKGSVNSQAVVSGNTHGEVRNKAYYDKVKQEMGAKAFVMDAKLQAQLHRDMMSLGDRWEAE